MSKEPINEASNVKEQEHQFQFPVALLHSVEELLGRKLHEGVHASYANAVNFELNDSDVKIIFGQIHQSHGKLSTEWHTSVTMAWSQAKLLSFFLRSNLALYETTNGAIRVPVGSLPPPVPIPPDIETNLITKEAFDRVMALRHEFFEEQESLRPKKAE